MWGTLVYFAVLLVVGTVVCLLNVFFTERMWGLFKSWRFKNPEVVEPSDLVVWWYRVTGIAGALFLIGLGVFWGPRLYDRARCEEVAPELAKASAQGVEGVERRGRELGLELEVRKHARYVSEYVITKNGKPFATAYSTTRKVFCDL